LCFAFGTGDFPSDSGVFNPRTGKGLTKTEGLQRAKPKLAYVLRASAPAARNKPFFGQTVARSKNTSSVVGNTLRPR
jgi:hypothetical protein